MKILREKGNLRIYQGDGMASGLYRAENKKTGKLSLWDNEPNNFKLSDCIY